MHVYMWWVSILGFRMAPPVVGRVLNLTKLNAVTSEKLAKTYFKDGNEHLFSHGVVVQVCAAGDNVCFYGVCYYCKPAEAACANGEMMEGSLTLWLPKWYALTTKRHPYQRTYAKNKKARLVGS